MMFKAFITWMYNEKQYEDYGFLQKHCSPELLKKLQDAYPYNSGETAYATWLFRSGHQDSRPDTDGKTAILQIKTEGEWLTYSALDMGWEFTNKIKLTINNNMIIKEDINNL